MARSLAATVVKLPTPREMSYGIALQALRRSGHELMALLVKICGIVGAWLFFVGPSYQAVLELRAEVRELDRRGNPWRRLQQPASVSPWWWLVPPVKFTLAWSNRMQLRRQLFASITHTEMEALVAFTNKARGWLLVAGGGLLAAIKETHQLLVDCAAPQWLLWLVVVLVIMLAGAYAAVSEANREKFARLKEQDGRSV